MPPLSTQHRRHDSTHSTTFSRPSILPTSGSGTNLSGAAQQPSFGPSGMSGSGSGSGNSTSGSTPSMSAAKTRQYAHLHSQLAQLNANLADTENLLRMTAVQAGDMRFLGGYVGALFMGSAKILGEEGVKGNADPDLRGKGQSRVDDEDEIGGKEGIKREESDED
ncbi:hypothetical protein NUU61_007404 [Penicillium alfredii]|uniref:High osmolarity sensitivity protein 3 n=1 Tax=Penicillium alfredii TaxID=1506179 RepID=A0A9W9K4A1_9EURO|nr:uncharacterized protein NUU61_007404 [Penicillium alfredii]KAJ5092534.1 hypothetical protein NUU61_007404 [Penicillium alfredii]